MGKGTATPQSFGHNIKHRPVFYLLVFKIAIMPYADNYHTPDWLPVTPVVPEGPNLEPWGTPLLTYQT